MSTNYLNLIPWEDRRNQFVWQRLRRWTMAWVVWLVVLAFLAWSQWATTSLARTKLELHRREYEPVATQKSEIEQLKASIAELQRHESLTLQLADERSMLQLMGFLSSAVEQCGGQTGIRQMHVIRDTTGHLLKLDGIAVSHHDVAQLATNLRETKAFEGVTVKSSVPARIDLTEVRSFRLECRF